MPDGMILFECTYLVHFILSWLTSVSRIYLAEETGLIAKAHSHMRPSISISQTGKIYVCFYINLYENSPCKMYYLLNVNVREILCAYIYNMSCKKKNNCQILEPLGSKKITGKSCLDGMPWRTAACPRRREKTAGMLGENWQGSPTTVHMCSSRKPLRSGWLRAGLQH